MAKNNSFKEQVRRNLVALISLAVAVTSLAYNSWRNEQSEYNRTQRAVAVETLLLLGQFQEILYRNHYDRDVEDKGNPRTGWTLVLTIRDITSVLDEPIPATAEALRLAWEKNFQALGGNNPAPKDAVEDGIESLRDEILVMLRALD